MVPLGRTWCLRGHCCFFFFSFANASSWVMSNLIANYHFLLRPRNVSGSHLYYTKINKEARTCVIKRREAATGLLCCWSFSPCEQHPARAIINQAHVMGHMPGSPVWVGGVLPASYCAGNEEQSHRAPIFSFPTLFIRGQRGFEPPTRWLNSSPGASGFVPGQPATECILRFGE